jgi:hypothetical protein
MVWYGEMSFFCLLWIPLFYLFWISLFSEDAPGLYQFLALFLGSLTALATFFLGSLIKPGGFGFSRWLSAYIDIVSLPVIIPLLTGYLASLLPFIPKGGSSANFALLWLIPTAVMRTAVWGVRKDPLHLVLVPLLWSVLAVGIPAFFGLFRWLRGKPVVPGIIGFFLLSLTAATSYWAFFSQRLYLGLLFLILSLVPVSLGIIRYRRCGTFS